MTELTGLVGAFVGIFIFVILLVVAIYVAVGIVLFKLNKAMYGKGTPMAFIPYANIYLLGKLTVNKTIGWILVIGNLVTSNFSLTLNGQKTSFSLLPSPLSNIVGFVISISTFGLFIYAIVKYVNIKNGKINPNEENGTTQTEMSQNQNVADINQANLNTTNLVEESNMPKMAEDNMIGAPVLDQSSSVEFRGQENGVQGTATNIAVQESAVNPEIQVPVLDQANTQVSGQENMGPAPIANVEMQEPVLETSVSNVEQPVMNNIASEPTPQVNNTVEQNQTPNAFTMKPTEEANNNINQ